MKKLSILKFTLNQFINKNIHIGALRKQRNSNNLNYIYTTKQKFDLINLNYTINTLKTILPTIKDITSINGNILTILNISSKAFSLQIKNLNIDYRQRVLFFWKPSLLSNFKEYKRQKYNPHKNLWHIPNFIVCLTTKYHTYFKTEIKALNIPCAKLEDTTTTQHNFLYSLPGNAKNNTSTIFFLTLIQNALEQGYTKRVLTFSTKKLKTNFTVKKKYVS